MSAPKPPRPWIVEPHLPLEQLDDNLWILEGNYPEMRSIPRRMHVVKLASGGLLFHNAVPMDDATLAQLRALGRPEVLLIPATSHTLDVHAFREKLGVKAYAPAAIAEQVREKVELAGTFEAVPADPAFSLLPIDGCTSGEAILEVHSAGGARAHLCTCDVVLNLPNEWNPVGLFMRLVSATGGPRVGPFFKWRNVTDKAAVRASLRKHAERPNLTMLAPSHGPVLRSGAAAALREAADHL